jgi:hypothetical protein
MAITTAPVQPANAPVVVAVDPVFDPGAESPEIPAGVVRVTAGLTLTCIVFALVLCGLVIYCAMQGRATELMIRLLMSCIACFVGLAFASLGFGLFLLRARGGFRARVEGSEGGEPKRGPAVLESTAPGLVVVVCATIVMWLALRVRFEITTSGGNAANATRFNYTQPADQAPADEPIAPPPHLTDGVSPP